MQLKQVVLPAPLGPISPLIEPRSTSNVAPSTATWPPKRLTRPETSSSTSTSAILEGDATVPREAATHAGATRRVREPMRPIFEGRR